MEDTKTFEQELEYIINKHSLENASNTPDFILAGYLMACLRAWNIHINKRSEWMGNKDTF